MMKVSSDCIAVIKHYEKLCLKAYFCPAGKQTIGYGTTVYPDGVKVKITDPSISELEAIEFLNHDVIVFENDVNDLLKVTVTQSMFDALVCFAYNVGADIDSDDIAEGLGDSTLLKLINKNIMATAADWKKQITVQFCSWVKGRVDGKRKVLAGLVARRSTEAYLFCDNQIKFFN